MLRKWSDVPRAAILFAALSLTGCASIHVDFDCQAAAPTVTASPSHAVQKHPVCGLKGLSK